MSWNRWRAALWAFHNSVTFREGALMAANLGDDADTTAAIYGQVGAARTMVHRGYLSNGGRDLALESTITRFADRLYRHTRYFPLSLTDSI